MYAEVSSGAAREERVEERRLMRKNGHEKVTMTKEKRSPEF